MIHKQLMLKKSHDLTIITSIFVLYIIFLIYIKYNMLLYYVLEMKSININVHVIFTFMSNN